MFDAPEPSAPQAGTPKFVSDLDTLIRARYPLVYLVSWEEQRLDAILQELAASHGKTLVSWSITRGLRRMGDARTQAILDPGRTPIEALNSIARLSEPSLVVLKDFHPWLGDPATIRALRDLSHDLKSTFTTVILLSPRLSIPVELEKEISVLEVPLPGYPELALLLREIVSVVRHGNKVRVDLDRDQAGQLIKAAQGLTLGEAENAFAKAIANDGVLDQRDIQLVLDEKRQVIRKSGLLEFVEGEHALEAVGGVGKLKGWLQERRAGFGETARRFGLPAPKGLLLLGAPGCGKSLTARAIASDWALPLLRLDAGRIFAGPEEENLRRAIRVVESVAPAVLWVDEIENCLASSGGAFDGGANGRVFGALLTWLQEKTAQVFVVATTNRAFALPTELLQRGRFDELFFIDLPSHSERREIFGIQLRRRDRDAALFDLDGLASAAEGHSGSEIEQSVIAALYAAFANATELSQRDVLKAVQETSPLSATMGDELSRLRDWAQHRARPAS